MILNMFPFSSLHTKDESILKKVLFSKWKTSSFWKTILPLTFCTVISHFKNFTSIGNKATQDILAKSAVQKAKNEEQIYLPT